MTYFIAGDILDLDQESLSMDYEGEWNAVELFS